jgi:hypothetical protein
MLNETIITIESIINQHNTMSISVELIDSTDNGSFKQAEMQVLNVWVGDVDVETLIKLPFVEMVEILKVKALKIRKIFEQNQKSDIT